MKSDCPDMVIVYSYKIVVSHIHTLCSPIQSVPSVCSEPFVTRLPLIHYVTVPTSAVLALPWTGYAVPMVSHTTTTVT